MRTDNNTIITICRDIQYDHSYGIFYGKNPLDSAFPLLLLELSSLIVISRVVRFLLKPLRQPKIISQIIGGIILGPSLLSGNKEFHKVMFPDIAQHVIRNISVIGFMYWLFLSGVKMDLLLIKKADKKQWYIGLVGVLAPLSCSVATAMLVRESLDEEMAKVSSLWGITSSLSISSFPVIYHIVKELNLLSSEMGRMVLSTAVLSDLIGNNGVIIFEATKQGELESHGGLYYMLSFVGFVFLMVITRFVMVWIVKNTPEGKPVEQAYVVTILLGVLVFGFVADMFGLAVANGSLWLGLVVPDGPPLGAILAEKTETIVMDFLLPFSYMTVGMTTDISSLSTQWPVLKPIFIIVTVGYTVKIGSTFVISYFFDFTPRDSLTLSLLMCLRGEVELLLFFHWIDFRMIGVPQFTLLVLMSMFITGLGTLIVCIIYDPTRPYMVNKRRNIQHSMPTPELQIVACLTGEESVHGLTKLLELSNPTANRPFCIYALCHIELVGRANPVIIDHETEDSPQGDQYKLGPVHNALKLFQEAKGGCLKVHSFTAITPKGSMHQDICELALSKQACLIILPLHKDDLDNLKRKQKGLSMTSNVLEQAPCSVAILVDKTPYKTIFNGMQFSPERQLVVLFLGGADARDALAYADRTIAGGGASVTVIRFLSYDNEGDNEEEKRLDDAIVTSFWVKHEGNDRIVYREAVVKNGEETINAIRSINKESCDLWIVGRKQGINQVLLKGLRDWGETTELGVIGDFIASVDFDSQASVLVVQQQILRSQGNASDFFSLWTKR